MARQTGNWVPIENPDKNKNNGQWKDIPPPTLQEVKVTGGFETPVKKEEEPGLAESIFTVPNAIRFGGSAIGSGLGMLTAPVTGPVGPLTGAFLGGAGGEALARWYEGKEFDPTITAIEGGLNLLPGGGAIPGKGAGLKAIGKYAAKMAGHGAWQGAAGSVPRHMAEEKRIFNPENPIGLELPSWRDVGTQTVAGGLIGGTVGATLGAGNVKYQNRKAAAPIKPVQEQTQIPLPMEPGLRQPDLPFDPIYRQPGDREVKWMDEPYLPYNEEGPVQGEFDFPPPVNERGETDLFGPQSHRGPLPVKETTPPNIDEMSPRDAFNTLSPDQPVVSPDQPVDGPETWPRMVEKDNWTPADVALWKSRGYVSIGVGPSGKARMIPGVTPPAPAPPPPPSPPANTARVGIAGSEGLQKFSPDQGVEIPADNLTAARIKDLETQGYGVTILQNGKALIKLLATDDAGTFDPAEMWKNVKKLSWADRPATRPVHGDERIPDVAFQPDEGVFTTRNTYEDMMPGTSDDPITTKDMNQRTETDPDKLMNYIAEINPNLLGEARGIYSETDPEKIVENLARVLTQYKEVNTRWHEAQRNRLTRSIPVSPELEAAQTRVFRLKELAQAKYERSATRQLEGNPESVEDLIRRFISDDSGTFNPQEMWMNLRKLFGRDPSSDEVQRGMDRQVRPGEPTGRVAPFDRRFEVDTEHPANNLPSVDPDQLQDFATNSPWKVPDFPRDSFGNIIPGGRPTDPETLRDISGPSHYDPLDDMPGPDDPMWSENQGLDVAPLRQQNVMDPRMAARAGSQQFEFNEPQGQAELPWSRGENPPVIDADLAARQMTNAGEDLKRPFEPQPEQLSMEDQMKDAEIEDYLRVEDALPPEMNDISVYRMVKDLAKRFIEDTSGTFDPEEMLRNTRRLVARLQEESRGVDPTDYESPEISTEQLIRNQRSYDADEIRINTDPIRAREIETFWREELEHFNRSDDTDAQKHAARMLADATRAADELETGYVAIPRPTPTRRDAPEPTPTTREPRIHSNRGPVEVYDQDETLVDTFDTVDEAYQFTVEHPEGYNYSYRDTAQDAREGITPIQNLQKLREATGPNPPITLGLQPHRPPSRGLSKELVTPEKIARLKASAPGRSLESDYSTGRQVHRFFRGRGTWDSWAQDRLDEAGNGEPGLSIEDARPSAYDYPERNKHYRIVFRGPDGKPIAMAGLTENGKTGVRNVHTLAGDRSKGIGYGKAVKIIGEKLFEINAAEASGTISQYTARAIARLVELVKDNAGSFSLSELFKTLQGIKTDILSGKPLSSVKFSTPDDVLKLMDKMANGRLGHLISDETGAIGADIRKNAGWGQGGKTTVTKEEGKSASKFLDEALGLSKAATSSGLGDYSGVNRQALGMVHTKQFRQALGPMFRAGWSAETAKKIDNELRSKDIFAPRFDPKTSKVHPSVAEEAGVGLNELSGPLSKRAESIASNWIENGQFFGMKETNPMARMYSATLGRFARSSNRAFTTLSNHIIANRFEYLMDRGEDMSVKALETGSARPGWFKQSFSPEEALELNPYRNKILARELGDFVKTAMGRAPLRTHIIPHQKVPQLDLEWATRGLTRLFFSPRLIASRIRMMNPNTYIMASPMARKEYAKSMMAVTGAWLAVTKMAEMAGAEVTWDPDSSDFGKIRIGNTRFDMGGGFLQYAVALHRFLSGEYVPAGETEANRYGSGYQAETEKDASERFWSNKFDPLAKYAYDLLNASEYQPFHVADRTAQLFTSLAYQDLLELLKKNPEILPWGAIPMMFGAGTQTYEKGESVGKIVPPEKDWIIEHGPSEMLPWNWND